MYYVFVIDAILLCKIIHRISGHYWLRRIEKPYFILHSSISFIILCIRVNIVCFAHLIYTVKNYAQNIKHIDAHIYTHTLDWAEN